MQQFVPRRMHIRLPLTYLQEICCSHNVTPASKCISSVEAYCDADGLYFITPNITINGPKYTEAAHTRPQLHDLRAR